MKRRSSLRGRLRACLKASLPALFTLGATGCDWWYYKTPPIEAVWYAIPWLDHMIEARYIRPYETDSVVRYTPEGSIPIGESEPDWSAEWMRGDIAAVNRRVNPFSPTAPRPAGTGGPQIPVIPRDVAALGDTLYQTFCSVCHGAAGTGAGPVQMGAPSLLTGRARAYSDGYIYGIIRYGRGVMPRYGDKIYSPMERWAVVNHVRKLQAGAPAPAEPPGAATPIPPAPSATGSTGAFPR